MIEKGSANINTTNVYNCNISHILLTRKKKLFNSIDLLNFLINKDANIHKKLDRTLSNILQYSIRSYGISAYLIDKGIDPYEKNNNGISPYLLAKFFGYKDMIELFEQQQCTTMQNEELTRSDKKFEQYCLMDKYPILSNDDNDQQQQQQHDRLRFVAKVLNSPEIGCLPSIDEVEQIRNAIHSMMEKTKAGYPNEFDYMCNLTKFENILTNVISFDDDQRQFQIKPPKCFARLVCSSDLNSNLNEFMFTDQYGLTLMPWYIYARFTQLITIAIYRFNENNSNNCHNLECETCFVSTYADHTPKTAITIKLNWYGSIYKLLNISLDIVPVIRLKNFWPKTADTDLLSMLKDYWSQLNEANPQQLPGEVNTFDVYCHATLVVHSSFETSGNVFLRLSLR
ncbi:unnamed protein product [Didymodactylos carnosus]|uniref:Mab-21-like nucleotidyltransferase domain-containing protein n=1 Tax=Didymodactylos carnosus TaxID=1234261 RepID=A0A814I0X7_9BILA|nr:unnamed protein product [Didymodactylos carnosus]CAF1555537.1 unnamed protein product [Didymodactylos carnosus]CAF3788236.1 unnamed protein product [Didymodactylos carnosus]CAF4346371.1 unnamed protein product [Didymodactylos carnosus]